MTMAVNPLSRGADPDSTEHARAVLNILEDFSDEKARLEGAQKAVLNMLEDSSQERARLEEARRSVLNILDDISDERARLQEAQKAVLNILDDIGGEKAHLEVSQKAILNMLEDLGVEKGRIEKARIELEEQSRRLETANRELEAFSYSVSHDLRAPLRALDGFSHILLDDYADRLDDEGRGHLERIRKGALLMGKLIDDMLRLSRVGRQRLRRERVDLSELALSIVAELRASDSARPVEFLIAPGIVAECDSALIAVALRNLLDNAWKYSAGHNPARIEFGATGTDGASRAYFVRDNGCGFDMKYAHKLFAPFQRLHRATEFAGTGIGLATVKRIVGRFGGRAWVESEVGRGTTVCFTLSEVESPHGDTDDPPG
jgi:signal transduction histidine kinase